VSLSASSRVSALIEPSSTPMYTAETEAYNEKSTAVNVHTRFWFQYRWRAYIVQVGIVQQVR